MVRGRIESDFVVACYNADGTPDLTLGSKGRLKPTSAPSIGSTRWPCWATGGLSSSGSTNASGPFCMTTMMYTANGQLDASFGDEDVGESANLGDGYNEAVGVAIQEFRTSKRSWLPPGEQCRSRRCTASLPTQREAGCVVR